MWGMHVVPSHQVSTCPATLILAQLLLPRSHLEDNILQTLARLARDVCHPAKTPIRSKMKSIELFFSKFDC